MVIMVLISSVMILKYFWNFDEPMFQTITYLFDGENEMFSITDGQIIISEKKDVFYCGHLKLKDGIVNDISAYQTSYYIQMNDENHIITINQVMSEDSHINIEIDDDLGKVSGKDYIIVDKNEDMAFRMYVKALNCLPKDSETADPNLGGIRKRIGECFLYGIGVEKNAHEALFNFSVSMTALYAMIDDNDVMSSIRQLKEELKEAQDILEGNVEGRILC